MMDKGVMTKGSGDTRRSGSDDEGGLSLLYMLW